MFTSTVTGSLPAAALAFAANLAGAQAPPASYAEDRALIEDLQARYIFAMDFRDADTYAGTFAPDGVLDWANGEIRGRDALRAFIAGQRTRAGFNAGEGDAGLRPAAARHNIVNLVLKVDGDRATARAYWIQLGNNNPQRAAELQSYGHYEDELRKIDGQWYFTRRTIYNEQLDRRAAGPDNPAW